MAETRAALRRHGAWAALAIGMLVPCAARPAEPATHLITMENMQFSPPLRSVRVGDRVVWTNRDLVAHTATAAQRFDSRSVAPNASWTFVAREPGRIDYVCTFHPTMKGSLVVE